MKRILGYNSVTRPYVLLKTNKALFLINTSTFGVIKLSDSNFEDYLCQNTLLQVSSRGKVIVYSVHEQGRECVI